MKAQITPLIDRCTRAITTAARRLGRAGWGAPQFGGSWCLRALDALGCKTQQFGDRLDVPVRLRDADVAEVRCEARYMTIHVETRPIPLDESPRREGLAEVLEARARSATPDYFANVSRVVQARRREPCSVMRKVDVH